MVGLVPTIQPSARSVACREVDPRDKPEDDSDGVWIASSILVKNALECRGDALNQSTGYVSAQSATRPRKARHFSSSATARNSLGVWAWAMLPGPMTTDGAPRPWNRLASVA